MRKTARIDQIFIEMGSATEDQISRALSRQKAYGGRLGENLIELGIITEKQLLAALSQQFSIPTATPGAADVPLEILQRLPEEIVRDDLIIPLAWNEDQKVLTLAVADPGDEDAMVRAKEALEAKKVSLVLAAERVIADIGLRLLSGEGADTDGIDGPRIELPELFELETEDRTEPETAEEEEPAEISVLMISRGAPLKNFLPPVFLREGMGLRVTSLAEEAAEEMGRGTLEGILLSREMVDEFAGWVRRGTVPEPQVDVTVFPSVSESLLGNPVAYDSMVTSLRASVQALADFRCAHYGSCPPYGLIVHDLAALAQTHRLSRVARDGLHLAAHLLLPTECEYAPDPETVGKWSWEVRRAAQLLAIVWYRHNHVRVDTMDEEEAMIGLRSNLREKAGKLAPLDVIEGYLSLIQDRGGATAQGGPRQVLLVGGDRIFRALSQELSRLAVQVIETKDLVDAQTLAERSPPGAIVVDQEEYPEEVGKFVRMVRLEGGVPLYVLTDSTDPTLVLNLLDIGANDVFGPTHEFDLMAARLNHAIRNQARQSAGEQGGSGQFSATFEVFSFLDLIQTLGHGSKSVRIDLAKSDGENATLFMEKGRIIHGAAEDQVGAEAVYRVIAWEEDGEFTVHQEEDFPEATIQASTESLLMEGCRLLDERGR